MGRAGESLLASTASRRRRRGDGIEWRGLWMDAIAAPAGERRRLPSSAGNAPCALGFMMSSVPMTAPAHLSPLAPKRLPRRAVGVKRLNAPRVRAFVDAASMSVAAMRTIVLQQ